MLLFFYQVNKLFHKEHTNAFDSEDVGSFEIPKTLAAEFMADIGRYRGVDAVDGRIRDWLGKELDV